MIYTSRITQNNPSEGQKTHELVINRLIEIWNIQPDLSRDLFLHIGNLLAEYDNPKPVISHVFGEYILRISKNGKRVIAGKSRHKNVIQAKLYSLGLNADICL